jgi:hypothetical protein
MAWIKRNLFFVISMAAGLILTGFCAYLLMGDMAANTQAYSDYQTVIQQLNDFQSKDPAPTKELANVKSFVADVRKVFVPFPTPPKESEEGFSAYLETTIADLTLKATNAGVGIPPGFSFAFTDLRGKLKYETDNIPPWMQQWEEIKVLCDILFKAKVNAITSLQRVPVNATDQFQNGADMIASSTISNATTISTPYKITVKTFSRELADLLNGLSHASNCFIVKNIVVYQAGPRSMDMQTMGSGQPDPAQVADPEPVPPNFRRGGSPEEVERMRQQYFAREAAWQRRQAAKQNPSAGPAPGAPPGAPVTVLREQLLLVTLSVEAVKIKAP